MTEPTAMQNATPTDDQVRRAFMIVFVLAFSTLMVELLLSRMAVFYITGANSFLAIPLTLFGLAVGSLRVHLGKTPVERVDLGRNLIWMAATGFGAFVTAFLVFSQFFPITHISEAATAQQVVKTAIFVLVFLPPFYFVGKILTTLYAVHRAVIGRLYGLDLIGAALGCFVTPVLLHYVDLPYLIFIVLLGMTAVTAVWLGRGRPKVVAAFVVAAFAFLPLLVWLEGGYDMSHLTRYAKLGKIEELAHKWNEYSRVSLLRITPEAADAEPIFKIIHNNAESNVNVGKFDPGNMRGIDRRHQLPTLLGRPQDRVLVMFAGCGLQMLEFNELGAGRDYLVGVEINPLVIELAVDAPELVSYRLDEFFALPYVEMHAAEGRAFLDNDPRTYDVIYAGSDAATTKYLTGHTRKYLDTTEAMKAYLDHLSDDGLLMFVCQPALHKIASLRAIFREQRKELLGNHLVVIGDRFDGCATVVFSKKGFSKRERAIVREQFGERLSWLPGGRDNNEQVRQAIRKGAAVGQQLVTDDRPFTRMLDFDGFTLLPDARTMGNFRYYASWTKILAMILVGGLFVLVIGGLYVGRAKMPPVGMMIYLVVTGFCYMMVEVTFIARLELFLENPLYSMSLLLSIFLLTNAAGSMLYQRFGKHLNMTLVPAAVAGLVLVTLFALMAIIGNRLGLPLPVKILLTILVTSPVGVALGLFYPYVVTWLADNGHADRVPITYGVSTLSSVAGATYAMTMIIDFGYASMIYQAAIGYLALTAIMLIYGRVTRS
jgi:hypothetical protein